MQNVQAVQKTNYQRMVDGEPYTPMDDELFHLSSETGRKLQEYFSLAHAPHPVLHAKLKEFLGSIGDYSTIVPPMILEYGIHLNLGRRVYINVGATLMDSAPITIGDNTLIGPHVSILTSGHPIRPQDRYFETPGAPSFPYRTVSVAKPIHIGSDCWIGAGAIILGGVTIGNGTTIGAGSVVTRNIPANVLAAGNPARVIRKL